MPHPSGIDPTIGRVVLYSNPGQYQGERPAIITAVHDDGTIDAQVFFRAGEPAVDRGHTASLALVSLDQPIPKEALEEGSWCSWMPYQMGQAAKTEAAEAKLAEANLAPDAGQKPGKSPKS